MAKIQNYIVLILCFYALPYSGVRNSGVGGSDDISHPIEEETFFIDYTDKRSEVIKIAKSYLGTQEVGGKGRGETVEMFQRSCGLGPGHDWCGCATKHIFLEADVQTPGANGWSPSWFPKKRLTNDPQSADVFSTFSIQSKRINHVGFVYQTYGNNVETLEGNIGRRSNGGLSIFGRLVRSKSEIHSYANWID
jgi:hypothetical protein